MIELEKLTVWKPRTVVCFGAEYSARRLIQGSNDTNQRRNAAAKTLDDFDWWHKTIEKRKANSIWKCQR